MWAAQTGFPVTESLAHGRRVTRLFGLPDSRRLLTDSEEGNVRLWKLPDFVRVPPWLGGLAEALAGKRDDGRGDTSPFRKTVSVHFANWQNPARSARRTPAGGAGTCSTGCRIPPTVLLPRAVDA